MDGSNVLGAMDICSRNGQLEPLRVNLRSDVFLLLVACKPVIPFHMGSLGVEQSLNKPSLSVVMVSWCWLAILRLRGSMFLAVHAVQTNTAWIIGVFGFSAIIVFFPDIPLGQNFCTTVFYSSLPLIWYATWLCLYKMNFGSFGVTPPWPGSQRLHQNSKCIPPVLIHRAIARESRDFSLNGLGAMVWRTDVQTDVGYHNIPAFSSKSAEILVTRVSSWQNSGKSTVCS